MTERMDWPERGTGPNEEVEDTGDAGMGGTGSQSTDFGNRTSGGGGLMGGPDEGDLGIGDAGSGGTGFEESDTDLGIGRSGGSARFLRSPGPAGESRGNAHGLSREGVVSAVGT